MGDKRGGRVLVTMERSSLGLGEKLTERKLCTYDLKKTTTLLREVSTSWGGAEEGQGPEGGRT